MTRWRPDVSRRRIALLVIAAIVIAVAAATVALLESRRTSDRAAVTDPFRRPPVAGDRLPGWTQLRDDVLATRRVAVWARNGRSATAPLNLAVRKREVDDA